MKINVTENKVSIKEEQILNENEYNIHKIQFDFSSEYTDDLVKVALFSIDNHTYKKIISNNECDIPPEVLTQRGYSILGVYAYKTEQDTLVLRYSPSPTKISVYDGSYKADAENSEPITPSEIEQYQQILQNSLQQFQNQYNALVEETEGDIQAIEDELQRKVDEGYFDGEDGFSPIATVTQLQNGARIEIEDKNGRTTADVLNGEDGYTPVRGIDYWTEEDKQEVEEEATQQIEGKIEEYNENAAEKLNQYNQNSVQKTNDYNTNAEQKMSAYNTNATEKLSTYNSNATEKFNNYNSNAEQKESNYNTNASQKVESFNTNASSKLSEYNSNAETKKSAYDENATQKTNSFNTNATNKLTEYNTNHTEKMSAYNSNSTQKLNAFNENATQKTEDFDEHTEEIQDNIETLEAQNERLRNTLPTTTGEGQDITLDKTAELEFKKPPLPMGNSEQVQYSGKNLFLPTLTEQTTSNNVTCTPNGDGTFTLNGTSNDSGRFNISSTPDKTYFTLEELGFSLNDQGFLNGCPVGGSTSSPTTSYKLFMSGQSGASNINDGGSGSIINANSSNMNGKYYLSIDYASGVTFNNLVFKPMIVKGITTSTDYEPYTNGASPNPDYPQEITNVTGDVEVVVGNKNLIDYTTVEATPNTTVQLIDNGFKATGKYAGKIVIENLKPNTNYYLQYIRENIIGSTASVVVFAGTSQSTTIVSMQNPSYFNTGENTTINIWFYASMGGADGETNFTNIQLEESTTPTDYVEHKEQVFTFPLGNEKLMLGDYLADDGIHHVRGQITFNGTEDFGSIIEEEYLQFYLYLNLNTIKDGNTHNIISNNYIGVARNLVMKNNNQISASSTYLRIRDDRFETVNDFKTWLQTQYNNGTPIIAEYRLAEEVIVPYTSAQQEVYNQIKQAISYEEQTNISGSSNGSNPIFSVEAYLDSKVILAEKVDKETGKGLSSNDFTNTYKSNVDSNTSARHTHTNKVVLDGIASSDITNWNGKQNETDNSLNTTNKTITGAINEVNSIAKLANQAKSYSTYQAFINYLNTAEKTEFIPGQSFMIQTKLVPDLWVYSVENTSVQYTYTTDEDFITYTNQATGGQVGYYKLAQLETQKVDLTDYATETYVNNLFNSIVDGDEVSY